MKPLTAFAVAMFLAGATAIPVGAKQLTNRQFARFDHTVTVGPLTVTPLKIIEDSRCPVDVNCIWAGRLVIEARIAGHGWRETRRLTLGDATASHGFRFALAAAGPPKLAHVAISARAYRFVFTPR